MDKEYKEQLIEVIMSYISEDVNTDDISKYIDNAYNEAMTEDENIEMIAALVTKSYISEHENEVTKLNKSLSDYYEKLGKAKNDNNLYQISLYAKLIIETVNEIKESDERFEFFKSLEE